MFGFPTAEGDSGKWLHNVPLSVLKMDERTPSSVSFDIRIFDPPGGTVVVVEGSVVVVSMVVVVVVAVVVITVVVLLTEDSLSWASSHSCGVQPSGESLSAKSIDFVSSGCVVLYYCNIQK